MLITSNFLINKSHDNRSKEINDEKEFYKMNFNKLKHQFDENKLKLKIYHEEYSKIQKSFEEKKPYSERKSTCNMNLSSKHDNKLVDTLNSDKDKLQAKLSESEVINNSLNEKNKYYL